VFKTVLKYNIDI